jgi:hypothetical protein
MKSMIYELQIDCHPSGNRNLKQKEAGATIWNDIQTDGLFANSDPVSFYKALASYVVFLSSQGHQIIRLVDTSGLA